MCESEICREVCLTSHYTVYLTYSISYSELHGTPTLHNRYYITDMQCLIVVAVMMMVVIVVMIIMIVIAVMTMVIDCDDNDGSDGDVDGDVDSCNDKSGVYC